VLHYLSSGVVSALVFPLATIAQMLASTVVGSTALEKHHEDLATLL